MPHGGSAPHAAERASNTSSCTGEAGVPAIHIAAEVLRMPKRNAVRHLPVDTEVPLSIFLSSYLVSPASADRRDGGSRRHRPYSRYVRGSSENSQHPRRCILLELGNRVHIHARRRGAPTGVGARRPN